MSDAQVPYNDEIDLFELFETLWDGKWLIVGSCVVPILIGFGYTQLATAKYKVSVPFDVKIHSLISQQVCEIQRGRQTRVDCMKEVTLHNVSNELGAQWKSDSKNNFVFTETDSPENTADYERMFGEVQVEINRKLVEQAKEELLFITGKDFGELRNTERAATNAIYAKRIINALEKNSINAVLFKKPLITKSSPKTALTLSMSVVLGGMLGVFFVLLRNAIHKRKKQRAKR